MWLYGVGHLNELVILFIQYWIVSNRSKRSSFQARPDGVSQKQSLLIGGLPNAPRRRRKAKRARSPVGSPYVVQAVGEGQILRED